MMASMKLNMEEDKAELRASLEHTDEKKRANLGDFEKFRPKGFWFPVRDCGSWGGIRA